MFVSPLQGWTRRLRGKAGGNGRSISVQHTGILDIHPCQDVGSIPSEDGPFLVHPDSTAPGFFPLCLEPIPGYLSTLPGLFHATEHDRVHIVVKLGSLNLRVHELGVRCCGLV